MSSDDFNQSLINGMRGNPYGGGNLSAYNAGRRMVGQEPVTCLPGNVKILTPSGPVPLDTLKAGDWVLSYCEAAVVLRRRRIRKVRAFAAAPILRAVSRSGQYLLRATAHHTVLTSTGWKRVRQLRPGDCLVLAGGAAGEEIAAIEREAMVPVFNLITEGEHTFIADGCVAHNFTVLRGLRTLMHQAVEWMVNQEPLSGNAWGAAERVL